MKNVKPHTVVTDIQDTALDLLRDVTEAFAVGIFEGKGTSTLLIDSKLT